MACEIGVVVGLPIGRWMAYNKSLGNNNSAIFLYNVTNKKITQVTEGFYSDHNPTFDPEGKYLYITTNRAFSPVYSDFDNSWSYPNATQLAAIPLREDVESPIFLENDTVAVKIAEAETDKPEKEEAADKKKKKKKKGDKEGEDKKEADKKEEKLVKIDLENFERRIVILPPEAGNMGNLSATEGKVIYQRFPNSGSNDEAKPSLMYYDLKESESKTIFAGANGYTLSADGKKILVRKGRTMGIIKVEAKQEMEHTLALKKMEMTVKPREEWQQIFNDTWRFQRDYFYDNKMHGLDWAAMRKQYGDLVQYCNNRSDLNFIIGELIGELNASHTYRGGGDQESAKRKSVGYLGVDWAKEGDYFQVKSIVRGAAWDNEVRSPLDNPGVKIKEGNYILAINGINLNDYGDPWAAFEGLADQTVELTYNTSPSWTNAKTALVKTLSSETRLRNLAWIEQNRKRVDEASDGKIWLYLCTKYWCRWTK